MTETSFTVLLEIVRPSYAALPPEQQPTQKQVWLWSSHSRTLPLLLQRYNSKGSVRINYNQYTHR